MSLTVGALVLAGGYSRRFGGNKLQASLDNGKTVSGQTLERIGQATGNILIVSRADALLDLSPVAGQAAITVCDQAHRGMGHTLAFGISQITGWDACLICLADMPFITVETYQQLLNALRPDRIVLPVYEQIQGNPAGFGKKWFPQLRALQGDTGGRTILRDHADSVVRIPVPDPSILHDIDTPEQLARYQAAGKPPEP